VSTAEDRVVIHQNSGTKTGKENYLFCWSGKAGDLDHISPAQTDQTGLELIM